jgi:hypothetical protein
MINTLEYDSMRSPGKAKMNAYNLYYMSNLLAHYKEQTSKPSVKPAEVPAPIKKVTKKAATKKES